MEILKRKRLTPRIYRATGTIHTLKEEAFIKEVVTTRNPSDAVRRVYNVKNDAVARSIASDKLMKPSIVKSIQEHLNGVGYSPHQSLTRLIATAKAGTAVKTTASDQIKADELLLKLSGLVIDRKQTVSLNVDITTLPTDKLAKLKKDFDTLLNEN